MRQLIILLIEFVLIVSLIVGIYITNLSKKASLPTRPGKLLMSTKFDLSDSELKEELIFFLAKELDLYGAEFQILEVVFLYTSEITGADYILVTLKAPDGRLCQITVLRNFLPWAKWELSPKSFSVIEPLRTIMESEVTVPKWMQDQGITLEQLKRYYAEYPDVALEGESAFFDEKTGRYNLPSDWYQTIFSLIIDKDKGMRLISRREQEVKVDTVNYYWKSDYPTEFLGLGYRGYLHKKMEEGKRK